MVIRLAQDSSTLPFLDELTKLSSPSTVKLRFNVDLGFPNTVKDCKVRFRPKLSEATPVYCLEQWFLLPLASSYYVFSTFA